jgi:hypothetical protein
MKNVLVVGLSVAILVSSAANALALGRDLPEDYLEEHGQLVKGQIPVHGFMVNWTDTFFYAGDTAALNKFMEAYAKRSELKLRVVLHPGTKNARSPWD